MNWHSPVVLPAAVFVVVLLVAGGAYLLQGQRQPAPQQPRATIAYIAEDRKSIRLLGPDGTDPELLVSVQPPDSIDSMTWSIDGRKLAYITLDNNLQPSVFILDMLGRNRSASVIAVPPSTIGPLVISPQGTLLAAVSRDGLRPMIIDIPSGRSWFPATDRLAYPTAFTSDGQSLLVDLASGIGGCPGIGLLHLQSLQLETVISQQQCASGGVFSSDHKSFAYAREGNETSQLVIADPDGTNQRTIQLPPGKGSIESLSFSPDNSRLVFSVWPPDPSSLWMIDMRGGQTSFLTYGRSPVWRLLQRED